MDSFTVAPELKYSLRGPALRILIGDVIGVIGEAQRLREPNLPAPTLCLVWLAIFTTPISMVR
jgi:hypothetical protein